MKISLYARIQKTVGTGEKKKQVFSWFKVQTEKRGRRIQPSEPPQIGEYITPYFLRYTENGQRKMESIGKNFVEAVTALRYRQDRHLVVAAGGNADAMPDPALRVDIADAVATWVKDLKTLDKAPNTITAYTLAANGFITSCLAIGKRFMDQIDHRAMLAYIEWIYQNIPQRAGGDPRGTAHSRLQCLTVFFRAHGIKNPLPNKQWPKADEKDVKAFSIEEVNKILSEATEDEKDLIQFFLFSGFRDDEVAHTFYTDIIWRTGKLNISPKREYGFRIKSRKGRKVDIPLPADFMLRMKTRRANAAKPDHLIFPSNTGRPDTMLLTRVRKAAKNGGYNAHFGLHRFRKTFGTLMAERFGVKNAQALLGHASIKTTEKYLATTNMAQADVEDVWAGVGK
jgi:integrase